VLEVGRIARSHGLKGQVVVELWTNRDERVASGSTLHAGDRLLVVTASSRQAAVGGKPRWIVAFEGVHTREAAEALHGTVLSAEPIAGDDGTLWIHELIGAALYDVADALVGTVEGVEANPASDLLVLGDGRVIPLTFVTRRPAGGLTVDGPDGLLDL
jgi:16S rRNA processing protein RimM